MQLFIKKIFPVFIPALFFFTTKAADTTQSATRIAVLVPLNLDSAFNGYEYNLSTSKIPQYFLSGLDFYNGVMIAVDSLQKQNANIEVWIYDTHKQNQTIQQLTTEMQPMNFSMIIAVISTSAEQKTISDFSAKNSIPVISSTFPNDAYLISNPFFLMINPTWKTHVDAVYDYLSKNYRSKKVTVFTRNGSLENKILQQLQTLNSKKLVNFSTIILNDDFNDNDVLTHLDSNTQNIAVCGSLYENFGKALIKTLNDNGKAYSSLIIGMPTWSGMGNITGSASSNIQIVITTPYNYLQSNTYINALADEYKNVHYSKPSDMVYKGYESMYHFTKLLLANPDTFINKSSFPLFKVSNDFNFQPVRLTQTSFVPDYLENKKLYYMKIVKGKVQSVN